jgi:hypothetical protein
MDLIFHIGTEKAGSTSLQGWLDENTEKLSEHGIVYCKSLLRPNNMGIYLYGLGGGFDDGFAYLGATTDAAKSEVVEKFRRDFLEEVAAAKASGARTFVISNEHGHSRLKTLASIQRVHDLLRPLFENISIWCFLRPQIDMCVSFASTLAIGGIKITRDLFVLLMQDKDHYFNYNKVLSIWAEVFGKDNITPIPFKRNKNVVGYFLASLSLEPSKFSPPKRLNKALDYRAIALSSSMGLQFYRPDGNVNRNAGFFIEALPVKETLKLDRDFAAQLQRNFAESNAEVTGNWNGIMPDDLEPDLDEYPVIGNLDRISNAEEFGEYFRFVVERFNALLWIKKSENKEAYSKIEELKGNFQRALVLCQEALSNARWANEVQSTRLEAVQRITALEKRIAYLRSRTNS